MSSTLLLLCHSHDSTQTETNAHAALCLRSLLPNLHKLTLHGVYVSLPALQPVATRLHELSVYGSRLQGSADSFLTKGWTALTSLSLHNTRMDNASLPKTLELPALEDVHFCNFTGHQGGELQLDQLTGSCPQVSRLRFRLGESLAQATEASRQGCRLLGLSRLADLHVMSCPGLQANVELDLPTSLTQLKFGSYQGGGGSSVNFLWALREAVKCVGRGARLHKLMCNCAEYLQPVQWGVSLDEQHRRLGCQLGSLRELEVLCDHEQLLSAVGAVASAAPCLVRLEIMIPSLHSLSSVEVPPICSASLESIRVSWSCFCETHMLGVLKPSPRQVLLTFLPGCTRLQEVVVDFPGPPCEGAAVKLRCHCCSRRCIVPQEVNAGAGSEVIVNFVRVPSARVQDYTVLSACHAAGPEQAPLWGHNVMPGIL